jgi:nucleotide-binding universal stress UspA family protein
MSVSTSVRAPPAGALRRIKPGSDSWSLPSTVAGLDRHQWAARQTVQTGFAVRLVEPGEQVMYQRILVPVDGSANSSQGLSEAISVAKLTGGRLRLVHVVNEPYLAAGIDGALCSGPDLFALVRAAGRSILADAIRQGRSAGVPVEDALLDSANGRVCELVVAEAARWDADLIVIGTHGRRGVGRVLLGSDAEQILRLAPVPVLLVRRGPAGQD